MGIHWVEKKLWYKKWSQMILCCKIRLMLVLFALYVGLGSVESTKVIKVFCISGFIVYFLKIGSNAAGSSFSCFFSYFIFASEIIVLIFILRA